MKKILILLVILSTLSVISCKKDDKVKEKTTLEKIQAKWSVENVSFIYRDSSIPFDTTVVYPGLTSDYFDFRSNGIAYIRLDNEEDSSSYALSGDSTIIFSDFGTYKIRDLTDNSLRLFSREEEDQQSIEQTINLKK